MDIELNEIKKIIKSAEAVLITAGAGMGVDSGLPDFRGKEGFWKAYPKIKELGLSFEAMANPQWFESAPFLAWAFYGHRLNLYRETIPHKGFQLLLDLVKEKNDNYFIFTSNVDGQFQKAGFSEDKIVEVHGSIHHMQCCDYSCNKNILPNNEIIEIDMKEFLATDIPVCPKCGGIMRPNILMFGDWHWLEKRTRKQQVLYKNWLKENRSKKIVIIEVGAGTAISTVRKEGEYYAHTYKDCTLIRINPRDFEIKKEYGYSLCFGGLEGISKILGYVNDESEEVQYFDWCPITKTSPLI